MKNKKGIELAINTLVIMILGLVILIAGTSIFFKAYNKTVEMSEEVDSQTQKRLADLLNDGSSVVVPITSKEAERGKRVDFNLGVNNELLRDATFKVEVEYMDSTGNDVLDKQNCDWENEDWGKCGPFYIKELFELRNNEQKFLPIGIIVPKEASKGQYIFGLDVLVLDEGGNYVSYGTRQLLTINLR